jgi:hypothetical protein
MAANNVLRIQSDRLFLLALATASRRFNSSASKRIATILPLALPFGSLGRPTFLGFGVGIGSELLNDEGLYHHNLQIIIVKHKLCPVKSSCCTIFRMVMKILRGLAIEVLPWIIGVGAVGGAIVFVARQQHRASEEYEAVREKRCASNFPLDREKQDTCMHDRDSSGDYLPWGYALLTWPEGVTAWAIIATGFVIAWQSNETRKAAAATADSANAAYGSVRLAEAQWELTRNKERARIQIKTVNGLRVENVGGEIWHLRGTIQIRNLGPSRAYIKRGATHLFVGESSEETRPEVDRWNSMGLDEDFVDPHSAATPPTTTSAFFFGLGDAPLSDYSTEIYEGRFPVNLYGVVEYETLGISYHRDFSYTWLGDKNPGNFGAALAMAPEAENDEERICFGFWRQDEEGNEEYVIDAD